MTDGGVSGDSAYRTKARADAPSANCRHPGQRNTPPKGVVSECPNGVGYGLESVSGWMSEPPQPLIQEGVTPESFSACPDMSEFGHGSDAAVAQIPSGVSLRAPDLRPVWMYREAVRRMESGLEPT